MNRFFSSPRFLVAAALATAALGAATVAEARPEVFLSIGLQSGPAWEEPASDYWHSQPVYVQPQPVYVQPQPVYWQPRPVYVQPRPVFVQPEPVYLRPPLFVSPHEVFEGPRFGRYDARVEWERGHDWRRAEWRRHDRHDQFQGGDHDRDHDRDHDHDDRGNRRGQRD